MMTVHNYGELKRYRMVEAVCYGLELNIDYLL